MHATRTAVSSILAVIFTCAGCVSSTPASGVPAAPDAGSAPGWPSPSRSRGIVTGSASATPFTWLTGGGPLAVLVVERMARTPFRTRLEVRATTVTTTDGRTTTVDGTQTGVINDQDFDLQIDTISAGIVSQAHVVAIGDKVYAKINGASWQASDRAHTAPGIEAVLREMRRTLNCTGVRPFRARHSALPAELLSARMLVHEPTHRVSKARSGRSASPP